MYKVIIVDDEINIVEGLKNTVLWHENGFEVCGVAYTGQEAYNLAIKL